MILHETARHRTARSLADIRRLVLTRASGPSAKKSSRTPSFCACPPTDSAETATRHPFGSRLGLPELGRRGAAPTVETAYLTSPPLPLGEGRGEGAFVAPHKTPSPGLRPASPRGRGWSLEGEGERPARRYGAAPSRRATHRSLRLVRLVAFLHLASERRHPFIDLGSQLGQFGFEPLVSSGRELLELRS
jgi:hypothetical protein